MSNLQQVTSPPQAFAEVVVNQNFNALEHEAVYGYDAVASSALTWGCLAGRWGGFAVSAAALTLTASSTNYIVVEIATGDISVATTSTHWDDGTDYVRVYKVTTGTAAVTAVEDHRAGPAGVHGGAGGAAGASLSNVNVWNKNQSVAPVSLSIASGHVVVDASLSNNFEVPMNANATLDNPTNLTAGQWLHFAITQDGTGSRTLAYGSKFKWPGGVTPTLSTAAGAEDTIAVYVKSTTFLEATMTNGFA